MKIKNISETADRIKKAADAKEKIILYGDSDLDGIASVIVLEEAIKNLGGQVDFVIFPNREEDGYGINLKALEFLKPYAPALFITLDLGIGNIKEVKIANELGFEVIIIDHHKPLDLLPEAKIIVNPSQGEDQSDFKYLCNAGLTFKITEEILQKSFSGTISQTGNLRNSFLELVALATISDMVPQVGDNLIFIEEGLRSMKNTLRPGLRSFLDILGEGNVASGGFGKIISALNSAESINFKNESYELLTDSSLQKCNEIALGLISKSQHKQQKIKEIADEIERRIAISEDEKIIFEGDPAWKLVLAGPVASIIASKYQKPTFIFKKMENESVGSVRVLKEGESSVEAMASCKNLLITYGGHPKASGFRIKNENIDQFKQCLINHFIKTRTPIKK